MKTLFHMFIAAMVGAVGIRCPAQSCPGGNCPVPPAALIPRNVPDNSMSDWIASPEAPHHRALVKILAGNRGGSGTAIHRKNGVLYILTAEHVVGPAQTATITLSDGRQVAAQVVATDPVDDLALLRASVSSAVEVIPVGQIDRWPGRDDQIELCGFGGSGERLRHWTASVEGYARTPGTDRFHTLQVHTATISGDSGGAMIWNGRLVGVIWGGPNRTVSGKVFPAQGTCCVRIHQFLKRCCPGCLRDRETPGAEPDTEPNEQPAESAPAPALVRELGETRRRLQEADRRLESIESRLEELRLTIAALKEEPPPRSSFTQEEIRQVADRVSEQIRGSIRVRVEPIQGP